MTEIAVSQVLAPADAAVWARIHAAWAAKEQAERKKPVTLLVRPGVGMPHSAYRYTCGCRCLSCTTAYQDRTKETYSRRIGRRVKSTAPHGTVERAAGGCRCVPCDHVRKEASS